MSMKNMTIRTTSWTDDIWCDDTFYRVHCGGGLAHFSQYNKPSMEDIVLARYIYDCNPKWTNRPLARILKRDGSYIGLVYSLTERSTILHWSCSDKDIDIIKLKIDVVLCNLGYLVKNFGSQEDLFMFGILLSMSIGIFVGFIMGWRYRGKIDSVGVDF